MANVSTSWWYWFQRLKNVALSQHHSPPHNLVSAAQELRQISFSIESLWLVKYNTCGVKRYCSNSKVLFSAMHFCSAFPFSVPYYCASPKRDFFFPAEVVGKGKWQSTFGRNFIQKFAIAPNKGLSALWRRWKLWKPEVWGACKELFLQTGGWDFLHRGCLNPSAEIKTVPLWMHDITLGTGYGKNGFSKALCTHTQSHWENQGVPDTFSPPKSSVQPRGAWG